MKYFLLLILTACTSDMIRPVPRSSIYNQQYRIKFGPFEGDLFTPTGIIDEEYKDSCKGDELVGYLKDKDDGSTVYLESMCSELVY